jgi:hypothetical protein
MKAQMNFAFTIVDLGGYHSQETIREIRQKGHIRITLQQTQVKS